MNRIAMFGLVFLAMTIFMSCDLDDDDANFHFTTLSTIGVDLPESFELGQTYEISVTYLRPDECTFFEGFDVSRTATTTRNVAVIGSVITDDASCAEVAQELTSTFTFEVLYSEDYVFRFFTGTDDNGEPQYLELEIPVN